MAELQLVIEGSGAVEASAELLAEPQVTGQWQTVETAQAKEILTTLTTIATIVGIVGGTAAFAEQLRAWWEKWRAAPTTKKLEKVILITRDGRRFELRNLTAKELAALLE